MHKNTLIFRSIFAPFAFITLLALIRDTKVGPGVVESSFINGNVSGNADNIIISDKIEFKRLDREQALKNFFGKYKSPLIEHTNTFISVADKHGIDFRLLPAISCIESSCGKKLIPESYNPFGWGIYGNNVIRFSSYDEAIEKVGEGIKNNYIAKGLDTPEKIAPIYTPPGQKNWLRSVNFFVDEINKQ